MHEPFWHYTDAKGTEFGPVTADAVRTAIRDGRTGPASQFWHEGLAAWIGLSPAAAELGIATGAAGSAAPPDPYATPRATLAGDTRRVDGGDIVYAGFWRRFAALFVDGLVLGVPLVVLAFLLGIAIAASGASSKDTQGAMVVVFYLAMFLVRGLYFAAMESSAGQATLGKRALGIKVTDERGGRLSFGHALARWFAAALSHLTFYIGFLLAGVTERKRALHDMVASTQVVDRWAYTDHPERQQREMSGCLIVAVVALGLMLFVVPILAAISISQYQDYVERAQVSEGSSLADGMKTAIGEYYNNKGALPADNAAAGLPAPDEIVGTYVRRMTVRPDGSIEALYSSQAPQKANSGIDGATLVFTPTPVGSGLNWQCHSETLRQKWCPSACACQ
jgi:uncharacterized RDD family membrane protein YckC/Tfp pilus assembly major pilin PilA